MPEQSWITTLGTLGGAILGWFGTGLFTGSATNRKVAFLHTTT
jgi:hypothetical protein